MWEQIVAGCRGRRVACIVAGIRSRHGCPYSCYAWLHRCARAAAGRPIKIHQRGGPPNLTVTWLEQFWVPASHTL